MVGKGIIVFKGRQRLPSFPQLVKVTFWSTVGKGYIVVQGGQGYLVVHGRQRVHSVQSKAKGT